MLDRVFSSQLADLLSAVSENPKVGFTLAVMGCPSNTDTGEFDQWRNDLSALSRRENVRITISALECVFGMNWCAAHVRPWIETVFELFGSSRIMFGSHRPISRLASNFSTPFTPHSELASDLSPAEQDATFRQNAADWFFREIRLSDGFRDVDRALTEEQAAFV